MRRRRPVLLMLALTSWWASALCAQVQSGAESRVEPASAAAHRPPLPSRELLAEAFCGYDVVARSRIESVSGDSTVGRAHSRGGLVIVELENSAVVPANLLDLEGRTLRFVPQGGGYRVESVPLIWDPSFGSEIFGYPSTPVQLSAFGFPFAGSVWSSFHVGFFGNLTFGADQTAIYDIAEDRFADLRTYGDRLELRAPVIAALFRRLGGFNFPWDPDGVDHRYFKQSPARAVVTWTMSEPYETTQSYVNEPRLNRFQARLYPDGTIELSYQALAVEDAVVGVFQPPDLSSGPEVLLSTIDDPIDPLLPAHIDVIALRAFAVGDHSLRFELELRGNALGAGHASLASLFYRIWIDLEPPFPTGVDFDDPELAPYIGFDSDQHYVTGGGALAGVDVVGNRLSFRISRRALGDSTRVGWFSDVADFDDPAFPFDQTPAAVFDLPGPAPASSVRDLSSALLSDPPSTSVYEPFHYAEIPSVAELACTVIGDLGDRFDMLAIYTDFRIDRQESGAVSTGPIGTDVTGIIAGSRDPDAYCTRRLQVMQYPSFVSSAFTLEAGTDIFGAFDNYDRQVGLLSHEIGHRWLTVTSARVGADTVSIGDVHWKFGLHQPSAFPVAEPLDNSPMGGSYWVDRRDGTYREGGNAFFVPATTYSYLDLYLMGLMAATEVPDFYLLEDLVELSGGSWRPGRRIDLGVADVIAAHGPRSPEFDRSQRDFNIGFVGLVEQGEAPSAEMIERMSGIRDVFLEYWPKSTGGRSVLTSDVGAADADCTPGAAVHCFVGSRFHVELSWHDGEGNSGLGQVVPGASASSGLFWFFEPDNWEMLVKVLDGCGINGSYWVFAAATTTVEYTLTVTDTATGRSRSYFNSVGTAAEPVTDTKAFACGAGAVGNTVAVSGGAGAVDLSTSALDLKVHAPSSSHTATSSERAPVELVGVHACSPDAATYCFRDSRFRVEVEWRDFRSNRGSGQVVPGASASSGLFWFFEPDNWEMLVKVLDGCAINGQFWVFAAATTTVEYELIVTDTTTGASVSYLNPLDSPAEPVTDTAALPCS